jgi:hypothetical protein
MKHCPECHKLLLDEARFCHHCGAKIAAQRLESPDPKAIAGRFFRILKEKVREEQDAETHPLYLQRFADSEFQQTFDIRMEQLAAEAPGEAQLDRFLDELADFFMLHYCRDLLVVHIPEVVLQYHQAAPDRVDRYQMIMDFLHFDSVPEKVYTNLLDMPAAKLRQATQAFLFPQKDERIFFICDLSLLGNCKEGFAMTDRALYWKAPMEKARRVAYTELEAILREKDWLRINGHFFHASPVLNIRLLKLLKRLAH